MMNELRVFLNRYFYLAMALIIAAIMIAGFGPRLDARLIHPSSPRPALLYFHAAIFTAWVLFFIVQTALVSRRNVKLHRRLGLWGAALGAAIPILGAATAIVIGRQDGRHTDDDAASLVISFYDMLAFAVAFGLAIRWRRTSEYHRRLMLIAACGLMAAAIARMLPAAAPAGTFYAGVDALILLGVGRDLVVEKRVHAVYVRAFPVIVVAQKVAVCLALSSSPTWLSLAHWMIG